MADLSLDRFGEFFAAVNDGHRPYRWQVDLLERIYEGRWPERVVAPTGTGKSAFIEVHVFLRALAAQQGTSHPRRLVLSVGRRALVDAQARRASTIAEALANAAGGVLLDVAECLRIGHLRPAWKGADGGTEGPLAVSVLRGGMAVDRRWVDDPVGCQILCMTPDLLGSRLLFHGYLASRRAWARNAGLLAYDTLVVVDESHLNTQLLTTLRRVGMFAEGSPIAEYVSPLRVVETTATPTGLVAEDVVVSGDAAQDPALAPRLRAPKRLRRETLVSWPLARSGPARRRGMERIIDIATDVRAEVHGTVGVILNRVRDVVEVSSALRTKGHVVATLVGPMRPHDRAQLERDFPGLLTPDGASGVDFIVATQTVEVGIDLDLHALVTEVAPGPSLVQRAGRVNRRGLHRDSPVVVLAPERVDDKTNAMPYKTVDIAAALEWLDLFGDHADFSPAAITSTAVPPVSPRRLLNTRLTLPEAVLLSHGSETLVMEPDLDFWLSESLNPEQPSVSFVGRNLPADPLAATDLVSVLPPSSSELYPVGMGTARKVLAELRDVYVVHVRSDEERTGALAPEVAGTLRSGDVVVLPAEVHVAVSGVVVDSEVQGRAALGDVSGLSTASVAEPLYRVLLGTTGIAGAEDHTRDTDLLAALTAVVAEIEEDARRLSDVAERVADDPDAELPSVAWDEVRTRLPLELRPVFDARLGWPAGAEEGTLEATLHSPLVPGPDGYYPWFAVTWRAVGTATTEELQEYSPAAGIVTLDDHQRDVAERAQAFAQAVGLPDPLVDALYEAGAHHDDGKAEQRFQLRLGRKGGEPLLAKSGESNRLDRWRSRGSLPSGWRHEQLSVAMVWPQLTGENADLVARLIGTSHGNGRVDFPHASGDLLGGERPDLRGVAVELFDRGGWDELIAATDSLWGLWGVAYLEALLRAADTTVSQEGH